MGGGDVAIASTERLGTVILGWGVGDYRDAGRVITMDTDGKIPNNNLRDAFNNAELGGIVKVTWAGGQEDAWKVPMVGDAGYLSWSVIPIATPYLPGGVTLASNSGTSADDGKIPAIQPDGKLHPNVVPVGANPTRFAYQFEAAYNGGCYLPVVKIAGAANTVFTAKIKLYIQSLRTLTNGNKESAFFEYNIEVRNLTFTGNNFTYMPTPIRTYSINGGSYTAFSASGNDIYITLPEKFINEAPTDQLLEYGYEMEIKEIFLTNQP